MKLAIVGSRAYTNKNRVLALVEKYVAKYGDLAIISGGCPSGGDALAKEIALELGLKYQEYAPRHAKYNHYCVMPATWYNQSYQVKNFFERNIQVAENCDHLLAFVIKDVRCNGTMFTVDKARHFNKVVLLFED